MRNKKFAFHAVFAGAILVIGMAGTATTFSVVAQGGPSKVPQLNISPEEQSLAKAIMSAPDPAAKLKASATLINKYPKTLIRPRVAQALADQIAEVNDASQKIILAQEYQKTFSEESEQNLIIPVLVDGYAAAGRTDDAFSTGAEALARQPDSLRILVRLTLAGTDEAKKQNTKFLANSLKYGAEAIALLEADKRPADMNDAGWAYYKSLLPNLYQSMGLLNVVNGNHVEAKAKFMKAAELRPSDPFNYLMIAGILNDDYRIEAKRVLEMPEGQPKQDALQKALAMLDNVIDAYAHMVAVAEGNAQFQQIREQYLADLESYYKYRHHSTDGLQQLINKYKLTAK